MEHVERLGAYSYRWSEGCFPLGADSLALGEFCTVKTGQRVLDLGCGAGLLLVLCARRCEALTLTGVEIDPAAAALCRDNLSRNGLEGTILTGDVCTLALPGGQDLVVSNPPWYAAGTGKAGGPGRMERSDVGAWCRAAAGALRGKGRFALVHAPGRLAEVFAALRSAGLEPKRLQLVQQRRDTAPFAALVESVKGGRPGLEALPTRILEV